MSKKKVIKTVLLVLTALMTATQTIAGGADSIKSFKMDDLFD